MMSSSKQTGDEGCLSLPGKAGQVTRPNHVVVRAFDENMEELLDLYNHNRFFLFGLKCEEMNLDESTINLLKDCFSKFGIYEPKAGCPDCYDKCEYYEPNNILCKRNCPIC